MMINRLKFSSLLIIIFFPTILIAQQPIIVWGKVDTIPDVNISIYKTAYGTTTNEKGEYFLPVYFLDQMVEIHFSSVGYQDTIIQLNLNEIKSDSIELNISIRKIDYLLDEVVVSAQPYFFQTTNSRIVDIKFISPEIMLLSQGNRISEIIIIDSTGTLILKEKLSNRYQAFHKDCFGYIELIGKDSCLQLYYDKEEIKLHIIDQFSSNDFYNKLKPCILEFEGNYLFSSNVNGENNLFVDQYHHKKIDYFYVNKNDQKNQKKPLASFFDHSAFEVAQSIYGQIISRYNQTTPEFENILIAGAWDGNILKLINNDFQLFSLISWYQNIESKPIRIEVFKQKDSLLIFDLVNYQILKYYHRMEAATEISIKSLEKEYNKLNSIIQDEKTENIYGVYLKNGLYSAGKINSSSGFISNPIKVSPGAFPDIVEIFNHFAYTVYYDPIKRISILKRIHLNTF